MKSDLIEKLVNAHVKGNDKYFREVVASIIADERKSKHDVIANRLTRALGTTTTPVVFENISYIVEKEPIKKFEDLVLSESVKSSISDIVEEYENADLLRSRGFDPRNKVLFYGSSGNGKTALAEVLAELLKVPFFCVNYNSLIGSYLGETQRHLNKVFEFVKNKKCVLFFDELDSIGKERGNYHDHGEMNRIVNSFLMQIDNLSSDILMVCATNHESLLDSALWRRFQVKLRLNRPDRNDIKQWLSRFESRVGYVFSEDLSDDLSGVSFAELKEFCDDIERRQILEGVKK